MLRRRPSLLIVVWLLIGLVVAANNEYLGAIKDLSSLLSAVIAIVAWPLVLLGVSVKI